MKDLKDAIASAKRSKVAKGQSTLRHATSLLERVHAENHSPSYSEIVDSSQKKGN